MNLKTLKVLLGIEIDDASKDVILNFVMNNVVETILNYCNIDELPKGLINIAYRMAIDLYHNESIGVENSKLGTVSSIREGDVSTSFNQFTDINFSTTILKDYTKTLNRYRRIKVI